ncbi:TraK domain-containing protein [Candidatus Berkiella aquae]|uniref:TraK protein n=1 Tax=Candidatus Berkiella aquae TaxID=295108 RepID=A0A0Q9YKG9_9GAMM|nr:type-F conjugative transfer system secretin TraK [Candidatus Berkiella aquae]MCS5712825.1 type-F conjugative transfer system secretin TraK [Candidatus Berkiella aquae]
MKKLFSIGLYFFSATVFSMQTKQIVDGQTVQALISQKELTRIFVQSDRIKDIKSAANDFTLEKDEENGQIFIMPHAGKEESITLFVTTELGKTITLSLKPTSLSAETLELVYAQHKNEKKIEISQGHEASIIQLMKAMSKRGAIPGYAVENMDDNQELVNGLEKSQQVMYQGRFKGKAIAIKNTTDTLIALNVDELKEPNIKAIGLAKMDLMPGESTEVYLVYGA